MRFFKGYKDIKDSICDKLELADLLTLKAVDRDCREYIDKHQLDRYYRYILGNMLQIGEMKSSYFSYKFPSVEEIIRSFPKQGKVNLYAKRGDAKEAVKSAHRIDVLDVVMTRPIFMVRICLPREPNDRKMVSYSSKDEVNGTIEKYTMIVNQIDVMHLVPCRVMVFDDQNRLMKPPSAHKGSAQQRNYMELASTSKVHSEDDGRYGKNNCIIL